MSEREPPRDAAAGDRNGSGDGHDGPAVPGSKSPPGSGGATRSFPTAVRADLRASLTTGLAHAVIGLLAGTFVLSGIVTAVLSEQMYATGDVDGVVALFTSNAAWLYGSLFALVGLFAGLPDFGFGRQPGSVVPGDDREGRLSVPSNSSSPSIDPLPALVSRWILVGGGFVAGCVGLALVAIATFESVPVWKLLAFSFASVAVGLAYAGLGVAIATASRSPSRAVAGMLAVYVAFVLLWDTWLVPMALLLLVGGADPTVLGSQPWWFDALVAITPGGAYGAIGDGIRTGAIGPAQFLGAFALLGWIVLSTIIVIRVGRSSGR